MTSFSEWRARKGQLVGKGKGNCGVKRKNQGKKRDKYRGPHCVQDDGFKKGRLQLVWDFQ
jgi:hypothetical protein